MGIGDYACEFVQLNFKLDLYQKIVQAKNQNNFGDMIKNVRVMTSNDNLSL